MLPAKVREDGKLVIGTDPSDAPNEFVDADGKTLRGVSIDLGNAVAAKLGLRAEFQAAPFDTLISALAAGKYELGMSAFTDTKAREKVVDFVTYTIAGTSWAVAKGNPKHIAPDTACGARVAVQRGVTQLHDVEERSKKCVTDGKPAIAIDQYQLQTEAATAVATGKDDAWLSDLQVVAYAVKQAGGRLEMAGKTYDTAPLGIAAPKDGRTAKAVQAAIEQLMADGTYTKLMDRWGVADSAIDNPVINGATF